MARPNFLGPSTPFQLRVPKKQLTAWRRQAAEERRDLSSWMRCVLDDYVRAKKKDTKEP
jgi:hypothetical protein